MELAYIRVSTVEQNEARQVEAMEKYHIEKWFVEKVSAKDTNRPKLQELIDFVREGDTIHIHDFLLMCDKAAIEVQKILPFLSDTWPVRRIGRAVIRASQARRRSCDENGTRRQDMES